MNRTDALSKMVLPGMQRSGKPRGGVIQIWITRACDKACFNCTQGSNLRGPFPKMTLEQFEVAAKSLVDYFGVVGVFGGNPATHPQFAEMCEILRKYIPKERCGLWSNKPFGHGAVMRETFNPGVSNLNVHLDREAYDEFLRDWPESRPFGLEKESRHSPTHRSMSDIISDESVRWDLISKCDINRDWSALIGVFRGELRAWFCEIAGAQAMLKQFKPEYPDTGVPVDPTWWKRPLADFASQIDWHCHRCGIPLKGYGELSQAPNDVGIEVTSQEYADVYVPKKSGRKVVFSTSETFEQEKTLARMTDYMGNANR